MKLTINIEKRYAYVILGFLIVTLGALLVYSYGGEQPNVVGHNIGEINWESGTIPTLNVTNICLGTSCISSWPTGGDAGSSLWAQNGNNIYYNSGNVGIGTDTPSQKLNVQGDIYTSGNIQSEGNITVNDIYITQTGKWASESPSIPPGMVLLKTNSGDNAFYIKENYPQKLIINTGEGQSPSYYCYFKMENGLPYLRALYYNGNYYNSGWVQGTKAQVRTPQNGDNLECVLGNIKIIEISADSSWNPQYILGVKEIGDFDLLNLPLKDTFIGV